MKSTITIGRDTPILTHQLFKALAERNEREAQRKAKIERLKATVLFWKRDRDKQRAEAFLRTIGKWKEQP